MHGIVFEITKSTVDTRAFLVDSYAICQEIHPSCSEKPSVGAHPEQVDSDARLRTLILQEPR